jgi:hypothetical protein
VGAPRQIIRRIIDDIMRVLGGGEEKYMQGVGGEPEGKKPLGKPRRR